jgi:hypothetical protein
LLIHSNWLTITLIAPYIKRWIFGQVGLNGLSSLSCISTMTNAASAPTFASGEDLKWLVPTLSIGFLLDVTFISWPGLIAVDPSSPQLGWRELFVQESPSDLSTTCGDGGY